MLTMGQQKHRKLNWLQEHVPEGLLVDAAWLERYGYSRSLRSKYVAHGWLEQVARRVYRRRRAKLPERGEGVGLRWQEVVISLQTLLECPVAVGGRTALELQGFAHYLVPGELREVHLYGEERLPGWVSNIRLDSRLIFHNSKRLFKGGKSASDTRRAGTGVETGRQGPSDGGAVSFRRQGWGEWGWPLTMSTPERAVLELLDEVPERETFHQADMLMEGLRNLSPRKLQSLLVECRSVKVKRLFLWFAKRHNFAWLKKLDRKSIDLGHGKRMLVRGGKLDTEFNITVPGNLNAHG